MSSNYNYYNSSYYDSKDESSYSYDNNPSSYEYEPPTDYEPPYDYEPPTEDAYPPDEFLIEVSNIDESKSIEDVKEYFSYVGTLVSAKFVKPGVAEIGYDSKKDAEEAVKSFNMEFLAGKPLSVELIDIGPGYDEDDYEEEDYGNQQPSYSQMMKSYAKQKALGGQQSSWQGSSFSSQKSSFENYTYGSRQSYGQGLDSSMSSSFSKPFGMPQSEKSSFAFGNSYGNYQDKEKSSVGNQGFGSSKWDVKPPSYAEQQQKKGFSSERGENNGGWFGSSQGSGDTSSRWVSADPTVDQQNTQWRKDDNGAGDQFGGHKKSRWGQPDTSKPTDPWQQSDSWNQSDPSKQFDPWKQSDNSKQFDPWKQSDNSNQSDSWKQSDAGMNLDGSRRSESGTNVDPWKQSGSGTNVDPWKQSGSGTNVDPWKQSGPGDTVDPWKQPGSGANIDPWKQSGQGGNVDPWKQSAPGANVNPWNQSGPGASADPWKQSGAATNVDPWNQSGTGGNVDAWKQPLPEKSDDWNQKGSNEGMKGNAASGNKPPSWGESKQPEQQGEGNFWQNYMDQHRDPFKNENKNNAMIDTPQWGSGSQNRAGSQERKSRFSSDGDAFGGSSQFGSSMFNKPEGGNEAPGMQQNVAPFGQFDEGKIPFGKRTLPQENEPYNKHMRIEEEPVIARPNAQQERPFETGMGEWTGGVGFNDRVQQLRPGSREEDRRLSSIREKSREYRRDDRSREGERRSRERTDDRSRERRDRSRSPRYKRSDRSRRDDRSRERDSRRYGERSPDYKRGGDSRRGDRRETRDSDRRDDGRRRWTDAGRDSDRRKDNDRRGSRDDAEERQESRGSTWKGQEGRKDNRRDEAGSGRSNDGKLLQTAANSEKPPQATANSEKPQQATANSEKPQQATANSGKPQQATANSGKPQQATANSGKPPQASTILNKPSQVSNNSSSEKTSPLNKNVPAQAPKPTETAKPKIWIRKDAQAQPVVPQEEQPKKPEQQKQPPPAAAPAETTEKAKPVEDEGPKVAIVLEVKTGSVHRFYDKFSGYENRQNIERLEQKSGTKLEISSKGEGICIIKINGTKDAVKKGQDLIETWCKKQGLDKDALKVCDEKEAETKENPSEETGEKKADDAQKDDESVIIEVKHSKLFPFYKRFLGDREVHLKEIQKNSGASITVTEKEDCCVVEVKGSKAAVLKGKNLVKDWCAKRGITGKKIVVKGEEAEEEKQQQQQGGGGRGRGGGRGNRGGRGGFQQQGQRGGGAWVSQSWGPPQGGGPWQGMGGFVPMFFPGPRRW